MSNTRLPPIPPVPVKTEEDKAREAAEQKAAVTVDSLGRKKWDKAFFAKKADEEQQEEALRYLKGLKRENDTPVERAPLRQRTEVVDLEKDIGKRKLITERTVKKHQGGYWCEVCECLLKDSQSYLDHLNGRDHNRNLGMNMRVEKVSVDRVKERLEEMKRVAREKAQKATKDDVIDREAVEERLEHIKREEEKDKQRKKEKKKLKKQKKREALYGPGYGGMKEEEGELDANGGGGATKESSHDELMRIMGISGFGGS